MTFNSSLLENIPHTVKHYPEKSTLLSAGDCAKHLFFIKSGAVRMWFNKDGKDYTLQFFFEDMPVCSFESFLRGEPSKFSIETIEPSEVLVFSKEEIWKYGDAHPTQKQSCLGARTRGCPLTDDSWRPAESTFSWPDTQQALSLLYLNVTVKNNFSLEKKKSFQQNFFGASSRQ